jgi:hypothetical protein
MRADVEAIVERVRAAGHLPWLRVIDAAELDRPVEQEADPETVVVPTAGCSRGWVRGFG